MTSEQPSDDTRDETDKPFNTATSDLPKSDNRHDTSIDLY